MLTLEMPVHGRIAWSGGCLAKWAGCNVSCPPPAPAGTHGPRGGPAEDAPDVAGGGQWGVEASSGKRSAQYMGGVKLRKPQSTRR